MVQAILLGIQKLDIVKIISSHAYMANICTRTHSKTTRSQFTTNASQRPAQRLLSVKITSTTS